MSGPEGSGSAGSGPAGSGPVRVDKWLWAVRVYRTRTAANEACSSGRVRVNGAVVKPAAKVGVGDEVVARRGRRTVTYRVLDPIAKRVSAAAAAECYEDLSTAEPTRPSAVEAEPSVAVREPGSGRPTKRERRQLDRLRGRRR